MPYVLDALCGGVALDLMPCLGDAPLGLEWIPARIWVCLDATITFLMPPACSQFLPLALYRCLCLGAACHITGSHGMLLPAWVLPANI